jgi:tungstate transport system substrate-binding protein
VDRATYNTLRWKLKGIRGMFQGAPELYNQYSVIAVSPNKHPHVNHEAALDFIEFVTGRVGQKIIGDFKDDSGGTLFVPNAKR